MNQEEPMKYDNFYPVVHAARVMIGKELEQDRPFHYSSLQATEKSPSPVLRNELAHL
jgi:hypothetical protein